MISLKWRDQKPDAGERGRDHAKDQSAREPLFCGADLLAQGVTVGQDAAGPLDDALALGGQAAKALAARSNGARSSARACSDFRPSNAECKLLRIYTIGRGQC